MVITKSNESEIFLGYSAIAPLQNIKSAFLYLEVLCSSRYLKSNHQSELTARPKIQTIFGSLTR